MELLQEQQNTPSTTTHKRKAVYTIIEREGLEKNIWIRIGGAWTNRDGSINVRLNALPVNGVLHVRDEFERETSES